MTFSDCGPEWMQRNKRVFSLQIASYRCVYVKPQSRQRTFYSNRKVSRPLRNVLLLYAFRADLHILSKTEQLQKCVELSCSAKTIVNLQKSLTV